MCDEPLNERFSLVFGMPARSSRAGPPATTPDELTRGPATSQGGASRPPYRNALSAPQPQPAPPIAHCSINAKRRMNKAASIRS